MCATTTIGGFGWGEGCGGGGGEKEGVGLGREKGWEVKREKMEKWVAGVRGWFRGFGSVSLFCLVLFNRVNIIIF